MLDAAPGTDRARQVVSTVVVLAALRLSPPAVSAGSQVRSAATAARHAQRSGVSVVIGRVNAVAMPQPQAAHVRWSR
ncbi:hypothetical protein Y887_06330 [Xanthomonas pisi DSM 18956]|nr:hypothetical protein Y887_06330 [Xanthomonas pisi DSM 18956]